MSLGEYLANCDGLWKEMRNLLAEENINDIETDLAELGESWEDWKKENEKQIAEFCLATPTERLENGKWWSDEKIKRRIIFAALQKCTDGMNLLLTLKSYGIEEPFCQGYRDMLETAGTALDNLLKMPYLAEPKDIFSFDPFSPLELTEMEFRKQS